MIWLRSNALKAVGAIILVLAIAAILVMQSCGAARTAKTATSLAKGQAGAATASGRDAVATVGARAEADEATDTLTRSNTDAIRSAKGAAAPVDPDVRDAGLAGLCRRASYRGHPRCVQRPGP